MAEETTQPVETEAESGEGLASMGEKPDLVAQFKAARKAATPLLAIRTADQFATIQELSRSLKGEPILVQWDILMGMNGMNKLGEQAVELCLGGKPVATSTRPDAMLTYAVKLPTKGIIFMKNAHNYLTDVMTRQGIINLRDIFKSTRRTLIMLGPDFNFPADLSNDVVILDSELPGPPEVATIVENTYKAFITSGADLQMPDAKAVEKSVDALIGIARFPAEQSAVMSMTKQGLDLDRLWELKRREIEKAPGLRVFRGGYTYNDVGGYDNVKEYLGDIMNGWEPPRIICFVDEIEKATGRRGGGKEIGGSQANSGMLGTLLSEMEEQQYDGIIGIGPPGSAKSLIAQATGNTFGVPTVGFDMNGMLNSLVGESEANMRFALKVLRAMGQGRVFFIATCNSIAELPPELRRRFSLGTFFFDLPTEPERSKIWDIHRKNYNISDEYTTPDDNGWTGAEIRNCCKIARKRSCDLVKASRTITPVAIAAREEIETLRREASGRYISASYDGYYNHNRSDVARATLPEGADAVLRMLADDDEE
jgi:hypothetical protein